MNISVSEKVRSYKLFHSSLHSMPYSWQHGIMAPARHFAHKACIAVSTAFRKDSLFTRTEIGSWGGKKTPFYCQHFFSLQEKKKKKKRRMQALETPLIPGLTCSLGYPYLLPEATNVYSKVNNGKVTEG